MGKKTRVFKTHIHPRKPSGFRRKGGTFFLRNYEEMKYGSFPKDKLKNRNKQMRSVWYIPTTPKSEKRPAIRTDSAYFPSQETGEEKQVGKHPTQKPLKLLERIILASTNKDNLILDPFTGSSTTGLAAIKHDRNFVGIDEKEEYLNLSIQRFKEQNKQTDLDRF